jgi:membrane fusion protein (multidrug efflux system)
MQSPIKQQIKAALLVMLAITLVLGLVKFIQIRRAIADAARFAPPPEVVTVVKVSTTAWRDTFQTVGSFAAIKGATLGTQESGNVVRVSFESGDRVTEGQVLLELDRSVEEANLQGALARLELAKQNLTRAQTLKSQSAVSLANYEDAQAKVKQAEAEARSIRGVIERKTIVAPFSGRAGIRAVNVGQYVNAGTPLVPLYSVDPIHFNFSVPQQVAPALRDTTENVSIAVDAFPNQTFQGAVTAVNRNINEITRAVEVQATIPNSREDLLPGMFGEVQIELGAAKEIVAVPVSSIEYAPYGNSVYVIERSQGEKGDEITSVRQQIVGLGNKRGDFVAVTSGLNPGDEVVTLGAFKLRPGAQVVIRADQSVPATLQPDVKNS